MPYRTRFAMRTFLIFIALAATLTLGGCDKWPTGSASLSAASTARAEAPVPVRPAGVPGTLAPMLARVTPAVVNISVQGTMSVTQNPFFQDPLFRRFFDVPQNGATHERFRAVGSGVIYDARQGYVVTNNHLVEHAEKVLVTLKDRRELNATVVATDPQTDVAILKIPAQNLTGVPFGTSRNLQVGDYVVAIGNAFGVGQTATFGIISALGRTGLGIEGYEDFIQTDASINPGNSGGALVDTSGRLIGINTAILSQSGGNVGVGFAIPIDMVKAIANQLIANGKVSRGELGVAIQDLTPSLARAMGVNATEGAVVSQVMNGSAAADAGIRQGDIIAALDGRSVVDSAKLRNEIGAMAPGTNVRLTILRNGQQLSLNARLKAQSTSNQSAMNDAGQHSSSHMGLLGLTVAPVPQQDNGQPQAAGAYVIDVRPGSAADDAGVRQGDIIVGAAHQPVRSPADLARLVHQNQSNRPLLLRVRRGDASFFVAVA
ncbi:MAG: Do family serine endopeptidase [Alphaproteobacteria bacterium]|nr:Do family serine endopeptidase [Alphaproteobacteria bacterium]